MPFSKGFYPQKDERKNNILRVSALFSQEFVILSLLTKIANFELTEWGENDIILRAFL